MVHQLKPTSQIQIRDNEESGPFKLSVSSKKPFTKVRSLIGCSDADETNTKNFIILDRYRFEVVQVPLFQATTKRQRSTSRPRSRSLRRENSLTALG